MLFDGLPKYISLKGALIEEPDGEQLIFGIHDVDAQVLTEHRYEQSIAIANAKANVDSLTGVKNKNAYDAVAEQLNAQINDRRFVEFAVTVFGMKRSLNITNSNDPEEEIEWIKKTADVICEGFKRSPVFRLSDDNFAVISQGKDYADIDDIVKSFVLNNEKNAASGNIVIPIGMAKYERDFDVASVYNRAVENLKENWSHLS